jgi:hypothetical protein
MLGIIFFIFWLLEHIWRLGDKKHNLGKSREGGGCCNKSYEI